MNILSVGILNNLFCKGKKMKKLLVLSAAVIGISILFAGCSSLPEHVNLTGKWKYTYGNDDKGTMTLSQQDSNITGTANNMDAQYQITGKVIGSTFSYEGKSDKNVYTANCTIISSNEFEGSYNTTTGGSGKIEAERQ